MCFFIIFPSFHSLFHFSFIYFQFWNSFYCNSIIGVFEWSCWVIWSCFKKQTLCSSVFAIKWSKLKWFVWVKMNWSWVELSENATTKSPECFQRSQKLLRRVSNHSTILSRVALDVSNSAQSAFSSKSLLLTKMP